MPDCIVLHEMYDTIQGESTLAGLPCTIVRLAGCPLRCSYCDTPSALAFDAGEERSIDEVVRDVRQRGRPLTLVTGGEPLAQKHCRKLLRALAQTMPIVQLETSGSIDVSGMDPRIRRIIDIKTPGSGEEKRNRWSNLDLLHAGDEIKFVVKDRADYDWAMTVIQQRHLVETGLPVLFSPVWDALDIQTLAGWILEDQSPVRLQWQLHKLIWGGTAERI
ncbi:MAG: radical SAM protein [Mariprofundaceae bacterium]